jgi:hypothetical protein
VPELELSVLRLLAVPELTLLVPQLLIALKSLSPNWTAITYAAVYWSQVLLQQ